MLVKNNYNLVVRKYFEDNWFQFIDICEIVLNTNLIKPIDLLTILNLFHTNLQFILRICQF